MNKLGGAPAYVVAVVDLEPKVQVGMITDKLGFPTRGHAHIARADPAGCKLGSRVPRAHTNTAGAPKLKIFIIAPSALGHSGRFEYAPALL